MRFFLDENFPKSAAELLALRGHEVMDIRGSADEGVADTEFFRMAQERRAVILTTDRDFYHTVPHLFESHHGVVVIALRQPGRARIMDRLCWFLDHFKDLSLSNRIFLLRDRTWRLSPAGDDFGRDAD